MGPSRLNVLAHMVARSASMAECGEREAYATPTSSRPSARTKGSSKGSGTHDTAGSNNKWSSHQWSQYRSSDIPPLCSCQQ
eukprot:2711925-Lingulodinium_polyedra.AAC.1